MSGKEKELDLRAQFDPLAMAGVDEAAEAATNEIRAVDGGEAEGARFGGARLTAKVDELCRKHGLPDGADAEAARCIAIALEGRMADLLEQLRPAARMRRNGYKEAFGGGAYEKGLDPKVNWKARHQAQKEAKAQAQQAQQQAQQQQGQGQGQQQPGRTAPVAAPPAMAAAGVGVGGGGNAASSASRVESANAADVLYVVSNERAGHRSDVAQWWRTNGGPLVRYARPSARLFAPP